MTELKRVENLLAISNAATRLMVSPDFKLLYEAIIDITDNAGSNMTDTDVEEIKHKMFFKETIQTLMDSKAEAEEYIKQNTKA